MKVLDFGVGLILDDVDGGRLTNSNETVGTARYMAPEQATQRNVTAAVDLYALGCVLYEMLIGAPPFDGDLPYEVLNKHIGSSRPRSACCAARCPPGWKRWSRDCWKRTRRTAPARPPRWPSCCCRSRCRRGLA